MSSFYALGYQKPATYIGSRLTRLVVPLIFGIFVIIAPLQVYLERVSHNQFQGSFLQFYPHYFQGWYGLGGNFAWMGVHLWYLEILFVFSLIMLPLFICLRRSAGAALLSRAAAALEKPGCIFLLAIPVSIMEYVANIPALRPTLLGIRAFGGWSLLPYLVFFSLGYMIAADARFSAAIEKQRIVALAIGIIVTLIGFYLVESGCPVADWFAAILRGLNAWAWLFAILGFGSRYLNFNNRFLKYANEAVLPFYILHQTVILTIGYYVVQLDLPIAAKYIIVATMSFVAIISLYDALVKRINMMRFLFGMKLVPAS